MPWVATMPASPLNAKPLSTPPSRPAWWPWLALAAMLGVYVWQQVVPLMGPRAHMNDFKHLWAGAQMLARGVDPYDRATMVEFANAMRAQDARFDSILPFVYLPFAGVVLRPLGELPFATAAAVWMAINHVLIIGGVVMAARAGGWRWSWQSVLLVGAAVALNFSVYRQNSAGQMNAVLLCGMAALALGLRQRWPAAALGTIAAFLALFKIAPGIFLIYFLITRRWRAAAWMVGAGVVMLGATVMLVGIEPHLAFLRMLPDMGYGRSTWPEEHTFWRDSTNQSLNAFFHRALVAWPGFTPWIDAGPVWANRLTMMASAVVLSVWAWAAWRVGVVAPADAEDPMAARDNAVFAMTVLASLLVPSICWDHYTTQALVPVLLLWNVGAGRGRMVARAIIVGCVMVMAWPVAFDAGAAWGISDVVGTIDTRRGAGVLVHSLKLWPLIVLFALAAVSSLGKRPANRGLSLLDRGSIQGNS